LYSKKRTIKFFEKINKVHKNKNILIVMHGLIIQALFFYLYKNIDWEKYLIEYSNARNVFEI